MRKGRKSNSEVNCFWKSLSRNETVSDAALIVEPYNISQITQSVILMIQDSSLRKKHIELGLNRSKLFNWRNTAKETLSVYHEVSAINGKL